MSLQPTDEPLKNRAPSLKQIDQWVCHNAEKKPIDPKTNCPIDATAKSHQQSFEEAYEAYSRDNDATGVGFVLTLDDDLVLVDLDNCLDENLEFTNAACKEAYERINSYTEVSVSERGLHILATGYNLGSHYGDSEIAPIEMYDGRKLCTFSGAAVEGRLKVDEQRESLRYINQKYRPFNYNWEEW